MKKIIWGELLAIAGVFYAFSAGHPAYAACGSSFFVGEKAEVISACANSEENAKIDGFTIDVEKNKITLNNYDGGAIYYFCRGTCENVKEMEIELVGSNKVTSESSSSYLKGANAPQNAAFINIVPKFTGEGSLEIKAGQPIAFEDTNTKSFSVDIMGADFQMSSGESTDKPESTTVTTKKQESKASFFETPLGIALIVAVPTLLTAIIIVLLVILFNKKNKAILTDKMDPKE